MTANMDGAKQIDGAAAAPAEVVVVTPDGGRRALYRGALRMAGIPAVFPEGSEEAESRLVAGRPAALVLDHGLPRAAVLQLYGMARDFKETPRVPILFVGQDGESDGDDHFLPGEPSPLAVAAQVGELVAPGSDPGADAPAAGAGQGGERLVGARASASGRIKPPAAPTPEPVAAGAATPAPTPIQGRRLDVIMLRIGIVLFLLGVAVLFFRMESLPRALLPPPTATPTPGPKPSGWLPERHGWLGLALVMPVADHETPSA